MATTSAEQPRERLLRVAHTAMRLRSELVVLQPGVRQVEPNGFRTVVIRRIKSNQEGQMRHVQTRNRHRPNNRRSDMLGRSVPRLAAVTVSFVLAGPGLQAKAADPAAGKSAFGSICSACHAVQPGKNIIGPSLFGVVGRKTGSVPGFHYSPANQNANITWDEATLDKYVQSPRTVVPGTFMTYAGMKDDAKRADLIAYLATLK